MSHDILEPSEDQSAALGLMESGRSILLTGAPGTGKTATLREFLRRNPRRRVVRLASSASVARLEGGQTVASFFGLLPGAHRPHDIKVSEQMRHRLHGVETLVIEGISQLRIDAFQAVRDRLFGAARGYGPFAGYQLICVGDFAHFPPNFPEREVATIQGLYGEDARYAFQSRHWDGLRPVELVTPHPQSTDPALAAWLAAARRGEAVDLELMNARVLPAQEGAVRLVAGEREAQAINAEEMARIPGGVYRIPGQRSGSFAERDLPVPPGLSLKPGSRVILCADGPGRLYTNGCTGTLIGCQRDPAGQPLANVRLDTGRTVTVTQHRWEAVEYLTRHKFDDGGNRVPVLARHVIGSHLQLPLLPGWAVSLHRAQGMAIDRLHIDGAGILDTGLAPLAIGRATRLSGLTLSAPLSGEMPLVDLRVTAFYERLSRQAPETVAGPARAAVCHAGP